MSMSTILESRILSAIDFITLQLDDNYEMKTKFKAELCKDYTVKCSISWSRYSTVYYLDAAKLSDVGYLFDVVNEIQQALLFAKDRADAQYNDFE